MLRLLPALCLAWLLAGDYASAAPPFGSTDADKPNAHKKDPTATAFELPSGTKLRSDQKKDFDALKKTYAPKLQQLIESSQNADTEKEKTAKAKEALKLRGEIKSQITEILNKPDPALKNKPPKAQQPQQPRRHR